MKKRKSIFLIISGVLVFSCLLLIWALTSPIADDYYWVYRRDAESHLAFAFSTALRINHPAAYDMVNPGLKPRLDEWMNVHQPKRCIRKAGTSFIAGRKEGYATVLNCMGENGWLRFEVDNIIIEDMKVIDWGEVIDEYY